MFTDNFGEISHKKIISLVLIAVSIVMAFIDKPIEIIALFLGSGLINIGMTVWMGIKNGQIKTGDNPPEEDEQEPPK